MSTLVRKRSTVSSDLTAESVYRILQEKITDDRARRLKASGELFNYNFQSGGVAIHTIDKQVLHDNQAVLRKLFDLSTVVSKVLLQKGIEKYDRRIGVCIGCCREDVHILKTHADGLQDSLQNCSQPFVFWTLEIDQSLQADRLEHEVGHSASRLVA